MVLILKPCCSVNRNKIIGPSLANYRAEPDNLKGLHFEDERLCQEGHEGRQQQQRGSDIEFGSLRGISCLTEMFLTGSCRCYRGIVYSTDGIFIFRAEKSSIINILGYMFDWIIHYNQ